MLKEILHCFKSGLYAVIEAGTGTGKSLAYLLPALYWNKSTGAKVVVSTHTINLQEQLWNQDIPNLERVIGAKINAALVKGRTNYLCLRKWEQRIKDRDWSGDREINFYLRILVWLNETATGDKTEINLQGKNRNIGGMYAVTPMPAWEQSAGGLTGAALLCKRSAGLKPLIC